MSSEITLPNNLTIHDIEDHFNTLNQAFNEADNEIVIQASAVESVDTSGLQMLLVLINNAVANDKNVTWQNTPEIISTGAEKIGINAELKLA